MRKRRVLVIASTYPRFSGDTESPPFVHELTRRLARWYEMHVLAPHAPGSATEEQSSGVFVHRFRYLPERLETLAYGGGMLPGLRRRPWRIAALPAFLWAESRAGRQLLGKGGFDLIHAHWAIPHGYIGARLKGGQKLVCTSHGSDLFALDHRWVRPFKRSALVNADAVTVVSAALQAKAMEIAPGLAAEVMPMGADMTRFTPPEAGSARSGLLYVGRLVQEKGVQVLLRALSDPRLRTRQMRLCIVGSGTAEDALKSLVLELGLTGQVDFLGSLPNESLPELYRTAQALIFPSLLGPKGQQEGMGLVPLEAIACGCPVIASRLPAVAEVVRDRETGMLFTPGDPSALADAIVRMLADPGAPARAAAGRPALAARYDWAAVAEAYHGLYARLLNE